MYSRRSSALVLRNGKADAAERDASLGRREARRARREGSWEVVNWAVGVRVWFTVDAGVEFRKASEVGACRGGGWEGKEVGEGEEDSFLVGIVVTEAEAEGEMRDCSWVIRAAFWA